MGALSKKSVILAAGGTGGHLFPAFALAEELGRRGIGVDLMTDMRGDRYGADFPAREIHKIPSATLVGRSPGAIIKTGVQLSKGVARAYNIIGKVKPAAIVGFGGYPSFPPLIAAKLRAVPSAVHEQNAVMGRANRMLAKYVSAVATSFEVTKGLTGEGLRKARLVGNPVRQQVLDQAIKPYYASPPNGVFNLVVFGGSQGARYFSDLVPEALALLDEKCRSRLKIVQQCREEDLVRTNAAYEIAGIHAETASFFANLPEILADAHLVIGRAGASTVAELAVLGRPAIMVPLPHALDNDQLHNARTLAMAGGGWCIEQKDLDPGVLANRMNQFMSNPESLMIAAGHAKDVGVPEAVKLLADLVEELAQIG